MIAICDQLSPQYGDMKRLAGALVGALNIEFRKAGWKGARILDAEYFDKDSPARLLIVAGPGHGELTVEAVSAFIKDKRACRAREGAA